MPSESFDRIWTIVATSIANPTVPYITQAITAQRNPRQTRSPSPKGTRAKKPIHQAPVGEVEVSDSIVKTPMFTARSPANSMGKTVCFMGRL
ncbi:MAG: hypothetical protein A4E20_13685 [Nitrospira sp. SG-bin2]|nr:MAG: hypothetical protein A4E20_13685 [Nitrospira sp. SG-bin2]